MSIIGRIFGGKGSANVASNVANGAQKAADNIAEEVSKLKPQFRFGGFQQMGAVTRPKDTRTKEQLLANIDYYAERFPEVAQFRKELKAMNPKHLGLVSDICELGTSMQMLNTNINMRKPAANGKSLFQFLLEKLPKASKENPNMLEFSQEVINHTDATASKYFLGSFAGMFEHPEAAAHLEATRPLIKDIAELTLRGGYTMDYSKEQRFVNALSNYINPSVDPEKVKIINDAMRTVENLPENVNLTCAIDGNAIVKSEVSPQRMRENLETFTHIAEGLSQKTDNVNLSDFIIHNVNLG